MPALHRKKKIIQIGLPRTGTSWIGQCLALCRGVCYLREPVLQGRPDSYEEAFAFGHFTADTAPESYSKAWDDVFSLKWIYSHRWLLSLSRPLYRRAPFLAETILAKEPFASLAGEYLADRLGARIVITVRHPCGYIASAKRINKIGHVAAELRYLLCQEELLERHFPEQRQWLTSITDPTQKLAAAYGMIYRILSRQLERRPDWVCAYYEDLCADPVGEYAKLFKELDLVPSKRFYRFIGEQPSRTSADPYSLKKDTARKPDEWKNELTPEEISGTFEVLDRLDSPLIARYSP